MHSSNNNNNGSSNNINASYNHNNNNSPRMEKEKDWDFKVGLGSLWVIHLIHLGINGEGIWAASNVSILLFARKIGQFRFLKIS